MAKTVTITRKARFSAAHFFYFEDLSPEENFRRLGPTSNRNGHGHNYELEVKVTGPVDLDTGMVMNLKDLKTILDEEVVRVLDFKNLNLEIPYFQNHFPTLENLSRFLWERLSPRLHQARFQLTGLKIHESDDLYVEYDGE